MTKKPIVSSSVALAAGCALLLAGCTPYIQDTSGRTFLKSHPELNAEATTRAGKGAEFRTRLRAAAAVEPRLRFPARIGIARIDRGRLSAIPSDEAADWLKLAQKLGPAFGEFVPVSPLIAEIAASEQPGRERASYESGLANTVRKLRLGAARQHVDLVLVYEVAGTANDNGTALSIADLSIVGAFIVPSRHLKAEGFAAALLLDVVNGYPYGTASARTADENLVPNVGSSARTGDLLHDVRKAAVHKLVADVEKMATMLYAKHGKGMR
ncbi:MAG: hypothetical protein KIT16_05820 [Rhodospirillaceae bacterium]|nr:hypothetical protein [Rhodospirillaceae bacterium]